jgi:hypothetical protein
MKIKEFFENCRYCYNVEISLFHKGIEIDRRGICTDETDFIDDYGDEEFEGWSVEDNEGDTIITFYLKELIERRYRR